MMKRLRRISQEVIPVCRWLLDSCPDIVRKLDRKNRIVFVGNNEGLQITDMQLIVSDEINVYEVVANYKNNHQFFFTVNGIENYTPSYLSLVKKFRRKLNHDKNIGKLLDYPGIIIKKVLNYLENFL